MSLKSPLTPRRDGGHPRLSAPRKLRLLRNDGDVQPLDQMPGADPAPRKPSAQLAAVGLDIRGGLAGYVLPGSALWQDPRP